MATQPRTDTTVYPLVMFENLVAIWHALPPEGRAHWRLRTLGVDPAMWAKLDAYVLLHPVGPVLLLPEDVTDAQRSAVRRREYRAWQDAHPMLSRRHRMALERAKVPIRLRRVCAWCGTETDHGTPGAAMTHGICAACLAKEVDKMLASK